MILDCHVATSVAKGRGMCTALAHPKVLLAPYIHPSIINPHVNCMFSCKCSCCRIYPPKFMGKRICSYWAIANWSKLNYQFLCSYCKVDGLRAWIKIEFRFPSPQVPKSQSWKHHQNYETRFCVQMWRAEETENLNTSYNWGYHHNVQAKEPDEEGKVSSPIFTFKSQVCSSRTFVHPSSSSALFFFSTLSFLKWLRCE